MEHTLEYIIHNILILQKAFLCYTDVAEEIKKNPQNNMRYSNTTPEHCRLCKQSFTGQGNCCRYKCQSARLNNTKEFSFVGSSGSMFAGHHVNLTQMAESRVDRPAPHCSFVNVKSIFITLFSPVAVRRQSVSVLVCVCVSLCM